MGTYAGCSPPVADTRLWRGGHPTFYIDFQSADEALPVAGHTSGG